MGDVPEPFVDVDDIAEVAAAALVDDRHVGRLYEVTGPEAITFADACRRIAAVTGRDVTFASVPPEEFAGRLVDAGTPAPVVDLLTYLFVEVLDGRNVATADGVHEALGRLARSFDQSLRAAVAMPGASEVR